MDLSIVSFFSVAPRECRASPHMHIPIMNSYPGPSRGRFRFGIVWNFWLFYSRFSLFT